MNGKIWSIIYHMGKAVTSTDPLRKTGNATEYPCGITCHIPDTGESLILKFSAVTGIRASVFTFRHDLFQYFD